MNHKMKAIVVAVGIGLASIQAQAVELYDDSSAYKANIIQQTKGKIAGFFQQSKNTFAKVAASGSALLLSAQVQAASLLPEGIEGTILADVKDTIADVTLPMFGVMTAVAIGMAALSWWGRGLSKAKVR